MTLKHRRMAIGRYRGRNYTAQRLPTGAKLPITSVSERSQTSVKVGSPVFITERIGSRLTQLSVSSSRRQGKWPRWWSFGTFQQVRALPLVGIDAALLLCLVGPVSVFQ